MNGIFPNTGALLLVGLLRTALAGCTVHLLQTMTTVTELTTLADLTPNEATFDGYAAKTVAALLAAYLDPAGGASTMVPTQDFTATDGTVPNTITGWWIQDTATPPNLWLCGTFTTPIVISAAGDAIPLSIVINDGSTNAITPVVAGNCNP